MEKQNMLEAHIKEENPGVLIKVDGRYVPCDKYLASLKLSIELALRWKDEADKMATDAYKAIFQIIETVFGTTTVEDLKQYAEDRQHEETRNNWKESATQEQAVAYFLMETLFSDEQLEEYIEELESRYEEDEQ